MVWRKWKIGGETFPIRESEYIASPLEMWQEGGAGRPSYSPPAINSKITTSKSNYWWEGPET